MLVFVSLFFPLPFPFVPVLLVSPRFVSFLFVIYSAVLVAIPPPPPGVFSRPPFSYTKTLLHTRGPVSPVFRIVWFLRSEEHTSELQSQSNLVCRLLLEKKKKNK